MGWSGNATIGYKASGDNFENNVFNGHSARLVACFNSTSNNSWTNVIYKLSRWHWCIVWMVNLSEVLCRSESIAIPDAWSHSWCVQDILSISGGRVISSHTHSWRISICTEQPDDCLCKTTYLCIILTYYKWLYTCRFLQRDTSLLVKQDCLAYHNASLVLPSSPT